MPSIENPSREYSSVDDDAIIAASILGDREDFVIDLRIDGVVESYLRGHEPVPAAHTKRQELSRRSLDVIVASIMLMVSLPLLVVTSVSIKIFSPGPLVFSQERVGRNGSIFRCLKFRTMHTDAEQRLHSLLRTDPTFRSQWLQDQKVRRDPRVTLMGRLLRKTSLDELPQLLNVLRGEMSIVGPRPVLPAETLRYGSALRTVLSVRPGITGLWQVSGRNDLAYSERVQLDLEYVNEQSLITDLRIIARTAGCVMTGHGAS